MTTRNEAAERLVEKSIGRLPMSAEAFAAALGEYCAELIAAERRATVERIRAAIERRSRTDVLLHKTEIDAILDEVAP